MRYICLSPVSARIPQCLTSHVMHWYGKCWLLDLAPFLPYWQGQAKRHNTSLVQLLKHVVDEALKASGDACHYRATGAQCPWQALCLMASLMQEGEDESEGEGDWFVLPTAVMQLNRLRWEQLWEVKKCYATFLTVAEQRVFEGHCQRFKTMVRRLGMVNPAATRTLNKTGIQRRFGARIADLWQRLWGHGNTDISFPWQCHRSVDKVSVVRNLDYPLRQWQQLAPFLGEDFDRLAHLQRESSDYVDHQRVVCIAWRLTYDDMDVETLLVAFRHPHDLQQEYGHQHTAVLQSSYCFDACRSRLAEDDEQEDVQQYMDARNIVSWTLTIDEQLCLPEGFFDLFGDWSAISSVDARLAILENELPVALKRYHYACDWFPEDSYTLLKKVVVTPSHIVAAQQRPLFLLRQIEPLAPLLRPVKFLETTMGKWWQENNKRRSQRHYYRVVDDERGALWVYQNEEKQWMCHGIFA